MIPVIAFHVRLKDYGPLDYEEQIRQFLETFREAMKAPQPDLGLPTLDPFLLQHLDLDVDTNFVQ